LLQTLSLTPDLKRTVDQQESVFQRLSSGLHELPFALEFSPWRLYVQAAAGSGKSVLAMEIFQRAKVSGERVLLACYNRPLADLLQASLRDDESVNTFHGHCIRWVQQHGDDPQLLAESLKPDGAFWDGLVDTMADIADKAGPYDWLIIDEGQDFKPDWFEVLRLAMKDDFKCLWLEDQDQALMGRGGAVPEGFVRYTCQENFRTPQKIAAFIDKVLGKDIVWRNPLPGLTPVVSRYRDRDEQVKLLGERVEALKEEGFRVDQIKIVSLRGQTAAVFQDLEKVAGHRIRKFTGAYDENQQPIYTDGELDAETIYRFKGQQAPAIILTDVEVLAKKDRSERDEALLWCGLTRALVGCEVIAKQA
jgi:superfamily I DNA and RNA helicase